MYNIEVEQLPKRIQTLLEEFQDSYSLSTPKSTTPSFVWKNSDLGAEFWSKIDDMDYAPFYQKFGFGGSLKGIHERIISALLLEQLLQGKHINPGAFEDIKVENFNNILDYDIHQKDKFLFLENLIKSGFSYEYFIDNYNPKFTLHDIPTGCFVIFKDGAIGTVTKIKTNNYKEETFIE